MSKISRDDVLQLIPAYVLGALDADDLRQVEALLATDEEAQTLVEQYRQIQTVLPLMASQQQPSLDLKDRLLQRLYEQDNEPLVEEPDNIMPMKPKRKRKRGEQKVWIPLVAALVVLIIGAIFVLTREPEPPTTQAMFYELANDEDIERMTVPSSDDNIAAGDLVISADGEQAILRLRELPEIKTNQAFQLWMIDENGAVDGGVYPPPEDTPLYIVIPNEKPIREYVRFGVSIEPDTGSPLGNAPTGDRVFQIILSQEQ